MASQVDVEGKLLANRLYKIACSRADYDSPRAQQCAADARLWASNSQNSNYLEPVFKMEEDNNTYSHCDVQLNLFSLMKITGLMGLCGGFSWALIISAVDVIGLIELARFTNYFVNLIAFPILGGFFGALFSFVGYPIYSWICKNSSGLVLAGIFHNPRRNK